MLSKFAILTVALTLAIPALADSPPKSTVHRVATVPKLGTPPGKGSGHPKNSGNNGTVTPCIKPGFNIKTNSPPC